MKSLLTSIFVSFIVFASFPVSAKMVCGDRSKIIAYLERDYQESRSGIGRASNGMVVELYTAKTGTWTMLITKPGGETCVIGSGESWEQTRSRNLQIKEM